jgi:hypothetical protein
MTWPGEPKSAHDGTVSARLSWMSQGQMLPIYQGPLALQELFLENLQSTHSFREEGNLYPNLSSEICLKCHMVLSQETPFSIAMSPVLGTRTAYVIMFGAEMFLCWDKGKAGSLSIIYYTGQNNISV